MDNLSFETSTWIDAPRERVWRAVTEPQQLEQWFIPGSPWEIESLEAGAPVRFHFGGMAVQEAVIEVVDLQQKFSLRWAAHESHPETQMVTTFTLADENNGTRVTIHEAAFRAIPDGASHEQVKMEDNGTVIMTSNLKAFVEGTTLPYP